MAVYELQELVKIRQIRENRASQEVAAKGKALEQAIVHAEQCRTELKEYQDWKTAERECIYQKVLRKAVERIELEKLRELLAALEEKETLIEKKVIMADKAIHDAQEALSVARENWRTCLNNLRKLEEHREIWAEGARIEEEREEQKEAEELRVTGVGAAGWDGNEY